MSACQCPEGPKCELFKGCTSRADCSVMLPLEWKPPLKFGRLKFACKPCWEYYKKVRDTPMRGIDRPAHASEDWRSSLMDMIRHGEIAVSFQKRNERPAPMNPDLSRPGDERFTTAQLGQVMILRKHFRAIRAPEKDK